MKSTVGRKGWLSEYERSRKMSKVSVAYWSQSGNTQAMAEAVAAGITEAGKEAEVVYVSDVNVADLTAEKAFALGCPAMGAEVLEEGEFEPFMEKHLTAPSPARPSHCLVPTAGATDSGCASGQSA